MIVRSKPNLIGVLTSLKGSIAKRIALRSLMVTLLASAIVLIETLHPSYFSKVQRANTDAGWPRPAHRRHRAQHRARCPRRTGRDGTAATTGTGGLCPELKKREARLAMAACRSMSKPDVPPPSPASQLPQRPGNNRLFKPPLHGYSHRLKAPQHKEHPLEPHAFPKPRPRTDQACADQPR